MTVEKLIKKLQEIKNPENITVQIFTDGKYRNMNQMFGPMQDETYHPVDRVLRMSNNPNTIWDVE